jgi:hypothetical protein
MKIQKIMEEIEKDYNEGHSGGSMGFTMRAINTIAKHGYKHFRDSYSC